MGPARSSFVVRIMAARSDQRHVPLGLPIYADMEWLNGRANNPSAEPVSYHKAQKTGERPDKHWKRCHVPGP